MACVAAVVLGASCGGDGGEHAGRACQVPQDCYPDVDPSELAGAVECLERVEDGYCTHRCGGDEDCCAVEGECRTDVHQVCAPFESTGLDLCFLSCEPEDIGDFNADDYCREFAHPSFICRSTGGGARNRRVCVPGG